MKSKSAGQRGESEWIGVAAVEDDGIYFTVAEIAPSKTLQVARPQRESRPKDGYSKRFIEDTIRQHFEGMELAAIAISMFGQINLEKATLSRVPRWDWRDGDSTVNLDFTTLFNIPVFVGHDSSTAAAGEYWEMKRDAKSKDASFDPHLFVRIRVGTGVGVGCVGQHGVIVQTGRRHPESGHIPVERHEDDTLEQGKGTCRAHSKEGRDCLEGLLSEEAILWRYKNACFLTDKDEVSLTDIPSGDPVWEVVVDYLAQLCVAITTLIAPDMIVIGGRTMIDGNKRARTTVIGEIGKAFEKRIGGYPDYGLAEMTEGYIRPSIIVQEPAYASLFGAVEMTRNKRFRVIEGEYVN